MPRSSGLAARAGVVQPAALPARRRLSARAVGGPRRAAAARRWRSRPGCSASRRRRSSRGSSRTSSRTCAAATSSSRRSRSRSRRPSSRRRAIGGWFQRALLFVLGAARRVVRAPAPLAEAGVRGRPLRRRALRVAARARRRAAAARAGDGARRVPGEPGDRAALHDESVRRGGPRRAVRHASRRSASACAGCARSTRTGARSCARPEPRRDGQQPRAPRRGPRQRNGRRPTLPGDCSPSTIGASGLNFSVRNGKRCFPAAMTAQLVRCVGMRCRRRASDAHPQNSIAAFASSKSRPRAISTGPLNTLLCLHVPPIDVVVFHGSYSL